MLSSWLHNCIFIHAINLPGPGNIFLLPWTFGNCVLYMVYGSTSFSVLEIFFFFIQGSLTWFLKLQKLFPKLVLGSNPWKGRTGSIQLNSLQFLTLLTTPSGKPSSTFAPLINIPTVLCELSSCSFSAFFVCSFFSASSWNVYSWTFQLLPLL